MSPSSTIPATIPADRLRGFLGDLQRANDGGKPFTYRTLLRDNGLPLSWVDDLTLVTAGFIVWQEGQGFVLTDGGRALLPSTDRQAILDALTSLRVTMPTAAAVRIDARSHRALILDVQDDRGGTLWERTDTADIPGGVTHAAAMFPADWYLRDLPEHTYRGNDLVVRF